MRKNKQFQIELKGFTFYGFAEVQTIETLPTIVEVVDIYIEGVDNDAYEILDYQIILDIEEIIRKGL